MEYIRHAQINEDNSGFVLYVHRCHSIISLLSDLAGIAIEDEKLEGCSKDMENAKNEIRKNILFNADKPEIESFLREHLQIVKKILNEKLPMLKKAAEILEARKIITYSELCKIFEDLENGKGEKIK